MYGRPLVKSGSRTMPTMPASDVGVLAVLRAAALGAEDREARDHRDLRRVLVVGAVDARVPDVDRAAAEAVVGLIPVGDLGLCGGADGAAAVEDAAVVGERRLRHLAVVLVRRVVGIRRQPRRGVVGVDAGLAAAADHAGGPLDGAEQVLLDVSVRRGSRPSCRARCRRSGPAGCHGTRRPGARAAAGSSRCAPVKRRTASFGTDVPSGRDVAADAGDRVHGAGRVRGPRVPGLGLRLVEHRQRARRRVHAVEELDVGGARGAGAGDARAGEAGQRVEERRAALLEQRGLADTDEAAAVLDVVLQCGLAGRVERVARRS